MTDPIDPDKEAQFRQWFATEERRRDIAHLRNEIARLDRIQFASYALALFWVFGTGIAYRMRSDIVPADVAGLITVTVFIGAGLIVWYIVRLKRELRRRLDALTPPSDQANL
ncbi:MAG TPA: hypothetical protein VF707_08795 [Ardenticatenaceae bacterium]